jgi:hypothetical protein
MASFKVPCPSCEHQVPIKGEELIGTKVECPKCKYRFKVEAPAGGAKADAGKGKKDDKKDKKKAAAGGAKSKKKVMAIAAGILAVGVLGFAAYSFIGGGKDTSKSVPKGQGKYQPPVVNPEDKKPEDPDKKPEDDLGKKPEVKKTGPAPSDDKATNLLPPETVAVGRFDLDRVRQTPAVVLFDRTTLDMFRNSFGLDPDSVAVYHHAAVGDARDPFGVIRLKAPVDEKDVVAGMAPHAAPKAVAVGKRKWNLYAFKSNPFATAVGHALHLPSLFAEVVDRPPADPAKAPPARAVGLCWYDSQHVLVGDLARLEAFLAGLDDKGLPKFRSAVNPVGDQAQAKEPLYLSVSPALKAALGALGAEAASPPPVVYAEAFLPGRYDPKLVKPDFLPAAAVLDPVLARTKALGLTLTGFSTGHLSATVRVTLESDSAAFDAVREHLAPGLALAAPLASAYLNTPVEFRNLTASGSPPPPVPDAGAFPGVDEGGPRPPFRVPPVMPKGPFGPFGPIGREPPVVEGQPGGVPPEGFPPGTVVPKEPDARPLAPSYLDLYKTDDAVTLVLDLNWTPETYRTRIEPRLLGVANTLRGKLAVFASDKSYYALTDAVRKRVEATKSFPRGTADRPPGDISRMGLKHPPGTRVSFFAELLPYLGREQLERSIDRRQAWSADGANLAAGEAWVPELLVSTYPETAWRAVSPAVPPGRVLGGTNYVAVAGVGLDAARLDPAAPESAKRLGITGYDWGSKVEEVADGLGNTIYLLQTPPGLSQPWIAGGGATVRGLDPQDPMRGFRYTHPDGKVGTYALMADGRVRWLPGDIKPDLLLAMATRAGGEDIADRLDKEAPLVDPPKKAEPKPADPEPAPPAAGPVEVAPEPREKK